MHYLNDFIFKLIVIIIDSIQTYILRVSGLLNVTGLIFIKPFLTATTLDEEAAASPTIGICIFGCSEAVVVTMPDSTNFWSNSVMFSGGGGKGGGGIVDD